MYDRLDAVDIEGIVRYIVSLQQEDGSFYGKYYYLHLLLINKSEYNLKFVDYSYHTTLK